MWESHPLGLRTFYRCVAYRWLPKRRNIPYKAAKKITTPKINPRIPLNEEIKGMSAVPISVKAPSSTVHNSGAIATNITTPTTPSTTPKVCF